MSLLRTDLKRDREEEEPVTPTKRLRMDTWSGTTASQGNRDSEVDPVVIVEYPLYQDIWDKLPVGTLFELARIVVLKEIDLEQIPRNRLEKLIKTNVVSMSLLLEVLGCGPIRTMEKQVAEMLDFEAQAIVAGDGRMLEHDVESIELSGKVHFTAALSVEALLKKSSPQSPTKSSPSKSPSKSNPPAKELPIIALRAPQAGVSNLFSRVYGSHRLLRVKILDRRRSKDSQLFEWALRPICILGRRFWAFVEKDDAIWYYMEGSDRVGRVAQGIVSPGQYGLGGKIPDVESLVQWWIPLDANKEQLMCKLATRFHLGISGTRPGPMIMNITVCTDIVRMVDDEEIVFTDGSGVLSQALARKFRTKISANKPEPAAYQIRLSTSKGVAQVAPGPCDETQEDEWIEITQSMLKARHDRDIFSGPVGGLSILGAAHHVACVVKSATCRHPARLSAQLIPILCEQGVPLQAIKELQEKAVLETIKDLTIPSTKAGRDDHPAIMAFAKSIQRNARLIYKTLVENQPDLAPTSKAKFDHDETRWRLGDVISSLGPVDSNWNHADMVLSQNVQLYLAVMGGLNIKATLYFMKIWKQLVEKAVRTKTLSYKIEVPGSVYCTIVPDFTGELEEGQISFTPPASVRADGVDFTSGCVLVGRHPAYLPTDVQKVQLANILALRERKGVIFFSTKGSRPLADLLAGGDYDGDDVILIWEPSLVEDFQNADASLSEKPPSVALAFERDAVTAGGVCQALDALQDEPKERARLLSQHLLGSLKVPQLYGKYNSYFIRAVHCYGLASEEARILGHKFNTLIDAPRTSFRLTTEAIMADSRAWDGFIDPLWKRKKDEFEYQKDEWPHGRHLPDTHNILDELYLHGEFYHEKAWLEANGLNGGDTVYDPAQNEKLALVWRELEEKVAKYPALEAELKLIRDAVTEAKRRFDATQSMRSTADKQAAIIELQHWFKNNPPAKDLPLVTGVLRDDVLIKVRASYAYLVDVTKYGGGTGVGTNRGFCWIMAIAPLLSSISSSPVTISYPTFAKLTPHASFCDTQEDDDQS